MSWWKKFVRSQENVFRGMIGKGPIGPPPPTSAAATTDPAATTTPMGGAATSNAGDAVVNYQTKGKAGLQQPGQAPTGSA